MFRGVPGADGGTGRWIPVDPGLPWLADMQMGWSPIVVGMVGLGLLLGSFVVVRSAGSPSGWIGLVGSIAALLILLVGVVGGRVVGAVLGFCGGVAFLLLVAYATPPGPVLWGVPVVVAWVLIGYVSGYATDLLRRAIARAYDRQARIARELQSALTPDRIPSFRGLDAAVYFRPSGDGTELGGDFYDVFELHERDGWGFFVGDVCGKGAEAAAVTALARHTVRTCLVLGHSPRDSLAELNTALRRRMAGGRFVTVAAGVAYPIEATLEITLCLGGHPQPLACRLSGAIERVGRTGTLLGSFADICLFESSFTLGPDEALVLYSDGVTDVKGQSGRFGDQRLTAAISDAPRLAIPLLESISQAVEDFTYKAVADDIVVLVLTPATGSVPPDRQRLPQGADSAGTAGRAEPP